MGRAKALLPLDPRAPHGPTFLEAVATTLRRGDIERLVVVGRPTDEPLRSAVSRLAPAPRFVPNPRADEGQLSSMIAAIDAAAPGDAGMLVTLVDLPLVTPDTVVALLADFTRHPTAIVRAVYGGRHGHPVIFPARLFDAIRCADPAIGAREVLRAHAGEVRDCDVPDAGVLRDVDTPADYARVTGARDPEE